MVSTHSCIRHHVSHIYKLWTWMGWKQSVKHLSNEMLWNEKATAAKKIWSIEWKFFFVRIKESSHIFFISCHSIFYIFWKASRSIWKWQTIDVLSKLLFSVNEIKKKRWNFFNCKYTHRVRGSERNVKCLKTLLLLTICRGSGIVLVLVWIEIMKVFCDFVWIWAAWQQLYLRRWC